MNIYVGEKPGLRRIFRSDTKPTQETHGHLYNACMGPFRTVRGAKAYVHYGLNNPHTLTVSNCEKIGKKHAESLKNQPKELVFNNEYSIVPHW